MGAWTWIIIYLAIGLAIGAFIQLFVNNIARKVDNAEYDEEEQREVQKEIENINKLFRDANVTMPVYYSLLALLWPLAFVVLFKEAFKGGTH